MSRWVSRVARRAHRLAVDHHTDVEADWDVVRDHLLRILEGLDVDPVIADELVTLPGADEVHALPTLALAVDLATGISSSSTAPRAPRRCACSPSPRSSAGTSIGCCPPNVASSRPCARPRRPRPVCRCRTARSSTSSALASPDGALSRGPSPGRRRACIVPTPGVSSSREARQLRSAFALHGYAVDEVVVNRVLPAGEDEWRSAWNRAQADGLTR